MDLKQLQYFVAVADEENMTAAAKKLFMSQPPLSIQIRALEEEMGYALFERGHRRLRLTEAGRTLYSHAVMLLEMSRIARDDVQASCREGGGTLRLGTVSSVGCTCAADWLSGFARRYPGVRYEIFEANTYEILEKLRAHIIQLAIVRRPFRSDGFEVSALAAEPLVAVGRNLKEADGPVGWEELAGEGLIVYRRWEAIIRRRLEKRGLRASFRCVTDDAQTTISLAERALGTGVVPRSALGLIREADMGCREIFPDGLKSEIVLVKNESGMLSRPDEQFIKYLREMCGPLEFVKDTAKEGDSD